VSRTTGDASSFDSNVFINCPFDDEYLPLLRPLLFTVVYLGFAPRIASERSDSTENRLDKIVELIRESRLSIHDISRLRATAVGEFARFNLPFELGIAHASRLFGTGRMRSKHCLILERDRHEYRRALSDLAGMDIKHHSNESSEVVRCVRDWFVETVGLRGVHSPTKIWYRFNDFASDFYDRRRQDGFSDADLNYMPTPEYIDFARDWVSSHGQRGR
jgi:hypothetical protein